MKKFIAPITVSIAAAAVVMALTGCTGQAHHSPAGYYDTGFHPDVIYVNADGKITKYIDDHKKVQFTSNYSTTDTKIISVPEWEGGYGIEFNGSVTINGWPYDQTANLLIQGGQRPEGEHHRLQPGAGRTR